MPLNIRMQPTNLAVGEFQEAEVDTPEGKQKVKLVDLTYIDQATGVTITVTVEWDTYAKMVKDVDARSKGIALPPKPQLLIPG